MSFMQEEEEQTIMDMHEDLCREAFNGRRSQPHDYFSPRNKTLKVRSLHAPLSSGEEATSA